MLSHLFFWPRMCCFLLALGGLIAPLAHAETSAELSSSTSVAASLPEPSAPAFAIRLTDKTINLYPTSGYSVSEDGVHSISDEFLEATVRPVGEALPDAWELILQPKDQAVDQVWFPWQQRPWVLNGNESDDVIYYPRLAGVAVHAESLRDWEWKGDAYPGECFAPLIVVANDTRARIVAAVNWPPRRVWPLYSRGRQTLRYDEAVAPGASKTYRALIAEVEGYAGQGIHPWQLAVDIYRNWLNKRLRAEGLSPVDYPDWLRRTNGWQNVQLENLHVEQFDSVLANWETFGQVLNWVQMWGQMSDFFVASDPETSCCLPRVEFHSRYVGHVQRIADRVRQDRGRVGYYARPKPPYGTIVGADAVAVERRTFLEKWLAEHRKQGANAYYIDVLGAKDFGPPLDVARWIKEDLPRESVIERMNDLYPAAFLISGSLWGGFECRTEPGWTPANLSAERTCVTYPGFGRYLLNDRIVFLGESNGDHMFWSTPRGHDHWTERQVFLLGAKFDAMRMADDPSRPRQLNRAIERVVAEWDRVGWWDREPLYQDRWGLQDVPDGVDIRHFQDKNCVRLLAIDNWGMVRQGFFTFMGKRYPVPEVPLRIVEISHAGGQD